MSPRYTKTKIHISAAQKEKLMNALSSRPNNSIVSIRISVNDDNSNDVIALTKSQITKLYQAYQAGKEITIRMSPAQLTHNMKVEGGFLGMLAGMAAKALPILAKTVLPALGVGALSGLASSGVQKAMGSGLYLKKGGCVCQIETDGKGLYLGPASGSGLQLKSDGLYLKKQDGIYDGSGLISNLLKQVPLLGMLV